MPAPKRVQVGPYRVQILIDEHAHNAAQARAAASLYGHWDPERLEITVKPGLPQDQEADTVLHELFHAMTDATALTASPGGPLAEEESSEPVVSALATATLDLLRRNPELVRYLVD